MSSVRTWVVGRLLEESLSHTLIDDDECGMGERFSLLFRVIFVSQDLLQLIQFEIDDFLAHRIAYTVTIDKNVIGEGATIELAISLKSTAKVILENIRRNNLLALLALRTSLCVVFAHILVIGGDETDYALLALVANINTNKHGLV